MKTVKIQLLKSVDRLHDIRLDNRPGWLVEQTYTPIWAGGLVQRHHPNYLPNLLLREAKIKPDQVHRRHIAHVEVQCRWAFHPGPKDGVEAIKLHLSLFRLMNHSHTLMMEAINKERDGFVMGEGTSVLVWIVDIMFLNI
jgi:hypothetical protein